MSWRISLDKAALFIYTVSYSIHYQAGFFIPDLDLRKGFCPELPFIPHILTKPADGAHK
jgi:hypothetical protein